MTGRYQQRFGIYANCDTQTQGGGVPGNATMMPRYFKNAGYATTMIGKWHLGDKLPGQHPLEKGFDEYFGFNSAQTDYLKSPILFDGRTKVTEHDYLTRAFTDRAIRFIGKSGDTPFFIYLAYNAVHGPNQAPEEVVARFPEFPPKESLQAAMVAELDAGIGRLLDALEQSKKSQDTLIFFLSDNGGLPNWWEGSNGELLGVQTVPIRRRDQGAIYRSLARGDLSWTGAKAARHLARHPADRTRSCGTGRARRRSARRHQPAYLPASKQGFAYRAHPVLGRIAL